MKFIFEPLEKGMSYTFQQIHPMIIVLVLIFCFSVFFLGFLATMIGMLLAIVFFYMYCTTN